MVNVISAPARVAPTVAQQIFTVGSAIASGLGGFLLARNLSKVADVSFPLVAGTTIVSIIATYGAAQYLVRHLK